MVTLNFLPQNYKKNFFSLGKNSILCAAASPRILGEQRRKECQGEETRRAKKRGAVKTVSFLFHTFSGLGKAWKMLLSSTTFGIQPIRKNRENFLFYFSSQLFPQMEV